jgi:hypothetical protein
VKEDVAAILSGPNYRYLKNSWETEEVTLLPISQITRNEAVFDLEKSQNRLITDILYSLAPILGCYYLLGATLILNPRKNLGGRLRIYLSLFIFSSSFLFTLQAHLPFHSSLTFPELLISNLTVSTAIIAIFSIVGNKPRKPWEFKSKEIGFHSKWDTIGLFLALLFFVIFHFFTLYGKMNFSSSLVYSYIIAPSYVFAYLFNIPKRQISEHKLKWLLYLIAALFPLELWIVFRILM